MNTKRTSARTYRMIKNNGLISQLRMTVYEAIYEHGPITISQMIRKVSKKVTNTGSFTGRISELYKMGLIYEHHIGKCPITGREVIFWDTTDNLPKKLEKQETKISQAKRLLKAIYDVDIMKSILVSTYGTEFLKEIETLIKK